MFTPRGATALRSIALAGAVALLAGCTALTEELPGPSETAPVALPGQSAPTPAVHEPVELLPEDGETLVLSLSGTDGQTVNGISLGQGETFVSWTCSGSGPIGISFSAEAGDSEVVYTDECASLGPGEARRNSDATMSGKDLVVTVDARPGQDWQLLVTQKTG